ncbi:hypothetical protein PACTADRAFT_51471 [Pachysolen tannophilus NRRL Y-2460]|uniref:Arf-GAP domain-containing protein n=1 Tax=Pachysolen tannophilus NRRL Y-2460 TaxID=669874 RepID=A0A1E4TPR5_PACTA|nr:hypothetical protein PACTADRAFT_51471 [Pachysolen tannophilus NRRL Y-2460]
MGRHQSRIEARLINLLNSPENANKCGECGSQYPTWASYNLGIFLCGRCASLHKKLGSDISKVKSLSLDTWTDGEIDKLSYVGNKKARSIWNPKKVPFPFDDEDTAAIEQYLRQKYIKGQFRYDAIDDDEYDGFINDRGGINSRGSSRGSSLSSSRRNIRGRSKGYYDDDYGYDDTDTRKHRLSKSLSRHTTGSVASKRFESYPKLTHRPVSSYERDMYSKQTMRLKREFGFTDTDAIVEALTLTKGNVNMAIEIMIDDQKSGRPSSGAASSRDTLSSDSKPPPLPKRKDNFLTSTKTGSASSVGFGSNDQSFDWLSGNSPPPQSAVFTGTGMVQQQAQQVQQLQQAQPQSQPQLLQYVDPNTGVITYVDPTTGQQYIDPNQQQMPFQQPVQTGLGLDKNTLLSLYQRPDLFSSSVNVTEDQKLRIQRQLEQEQQLALQQQQQQLALQQQIALQQQQQQQQQAYYLQQQGHTGFFG